MRAPALLLVALLAVPMVDAAGWSLLAHRYSEAPGWWTESFTAGASEHIAISIGHHSEGEFVGHVIVLYDGDEKRLGQALLVSLGGQVVDATVRSGDAEVTTEGKPGLVRNGVLETVVSFRCGVDCNPSRAFKLAVTGAGDLETWGYGLFTYDGGAAIANATGTQAWALTSWQMNGTTAHARGPFGGVSVVQDARVETFVSDTLVGAFVKQRGGHAERMSVETPQGEVDCACFFGDWGPGGYTFHYADVDTFGDEAYLAYADVRLP